MAVMYEIPALQILSSFQSMPVDGRHRMAALDRLDQLSTDSEDWEGELAAITLGFVDALLEGDSEALAEAGDPLRDRLPSLFGQDAHAAEIRGWLLALLA